jgi:small acid-soluble spore protein K (minor)
VVLGLVDRGEKRYPVQNENSIQPRAKAEYASKRADGSTNDHPAERMLKSSQRDEGDF